MVGKPSQKVFPLLIATLTGTGLSGCAINSIDEATIFASPATFELYDCADLAPQRVALQARVEELQGLMMKAQTGVGGSFIAEIAYRPDYLAAQARLKSANAAWERSRCDSAARAADPAFKLPSPGMEPTGGRSKTRIY